MERIHATVHTWKMTVDTVEYMRNATVRATVTCLSCTRRNTLGSGSESEEPGDVGCPGMGYMAWSGSPLDKGRSRCLLLKICDKTRGLAASRVGGLEGGYVQSVL